MAAHSGSPSAVVTGVNYSYLEMNHFTCARCQSAPWQQVLSFSSHLTLARRFVHYDSSKRCVFLIEIDRANQLCVYARAPSISTDRANRLTDEKTDAKTQRRKPVVAGTQREKKLFRIRTHSGIRFEYGSSCSATSRSLRVSDD